MKDSRDEIDALAGEYVLGVLEPEQCQAIEVRMQHDESLKAAIARWRTKFGELDATADPLQPSPDLWRNIEREIAAPPVASARQASNVASGLWSNLRFWRMAGCASAALALVLAIGLASRLNSGPEPVVIAILETQDSTPGVIVEAYADGSIRLVPLTDIPVPAGRALQVWTLWDQARGPVPLGLLGRAQEAKLSLPGQPTPRPQQLYEITLEPAAGSPTGRPTGPILYKGYAAAPR